MAKTKDEPKTDSEPSPLEGAVADLKGTLSKKDDLLEEVMHALHRGRRLVPTSSAAHDFQRIYEKVRFSLGERGQKVDAGIRG